MKKILLDTNFLLIPSALGVDIFKEIARIADFKYGLCILDRTRDELDRIINTQSGRHRSAAKLALELISAQHLKILKTETHKNVDELILSKANSRNFIVATQDRELKRKLRLKNVPIIVLRQKRYVRII